MKLNDVCEVITCGVAKRPNYVEDGIPFLSSKNVKEDRFILDSYNYVSKEDYLKLTKHNKPEKGDILYTRVGSFGQAAVVDFDFEFAVFVSLTLIKPKKEIVNSRYLMHYLNNPFIRNLANNSTSGIGVQNLNVKVVREFPIELPPLKTQQRIATILDNAAALRDKTAQLLTEYDLLAQSIFLEMFGDPVRNPKGWKNESIKKLGKVTTGNTPSRSVTEYYGDFIEWIKTDNINTPNLHLTTAREYLSELGLTKGRVVNKGALLVTCIAGSRKVIGNVSIADREVSFNQQINAFEPFNRCSMFWYYHFILAKSYVQNNSTKGMKGIITKGKFEKMNFINPPIELQNQFAEKIALIEQQKALAKQELQESEDLFNCLLQKAFKGDL